MTTGKHYEDFYNEKLINRILDKWAWRKQICEDANICERTLENFVKRLSDMTPENKYSVMLALKIDPAVFHFISVKEKEEYMKKNKIN